MPKSQKTLPPVTLPSPLIRHAEGYSFSFSIAACGNFSEGILCDFLMTRDAFISRHPLICRNASEEGGRFLSDTTARATQIELPTIATLVFVPGFTCSARLGIWKSPPHTTLLPMEEGYRPSTKISSAGSSSGRSRIKRTWPKYRFGPTYCKVKRRKKLCKDNFGMSITHFSPSSHCPHLLLISGLRMPHGFPNDHGTTIPTN